MAFRMRPMKFGDTPAEIENRRKTLLIYTFATLGSVFLMTFALASLFSGRLELGGILVLTSAAVLSLAYVTRRLRSAQPISLALATILLFLSSYLVLTGGVGGTGFYWSYPFVMLMVLLVGPRAGTVYLLLYLAIIGAGLASGMPWIYDYEPHHAVRFMAALLALSILLLGSEWIRVLSYGAITVTAENHRQLAHRDALTGTLNRAGVDHVMADWPADTDAVVALVDMDHFKAVNDSHGHDVGDRALVKLVRLLKGNTKGRDLVVRWGGEEFLLLLPHTSLAAAWQLVDSIRWQLEREPLRAGRQQVALSFSAGLAVMQGIDGFEAAVKAADEQLYAAKHAGRNRVLAEGLPAPA